MPISLNPLLLGLGLAIAITAGAQAQSQAPVQPQVPTQVEPRANIADLPMPGPRPSSLDHIKQDTHMPVIPTGAYPGPNAGATNGQMPQHFDKPAGYDGSIAMHPYENGVGPKPN